MPGSPRSSAATPLPREALAHPAPVKPTLLCSMIDDIAIRPADSQEDGMLRRAEEVGLGHRKPHGEPSFLFQVCQVG